MGLLTVHFTTDGDAFAGEAITDECALAVTRIATKLAHGEREDAVLDSNGNSIGEWHLDAPLYLSDFPLCSQCEQSLAAHSGEDGDGGHFPPCGDCGAMVGYSQKAGEWFHVAPNTPDCFLATVAPSGTALVGCEPEVPVLSGPEQALLATIRTLGGEFPAAALALVNDAISWRESVAEAEAEQARDHYEMPHHHDALNPSGADNCERCAKEAEARDA